MIFYDVSKKQHVGLNRIKSFFKGKGGGQNIFFKSYFLLLLLNMLILGLTDLGTERGRK